VCNQIWWVVDRQVKQFSGSFYDYKKAALKRINSAHKGK
jgi:hypothetical protein